jgi:hypothetical protein
LVFLGIPGTDFSTTANVNKQKSRLAQKQSDVKSLSKGKRFRATKRAEPTKELMFMQKKKKNVCAKDGRWQVEAV